MSSLLKGGAVLLISACFAAPGSAQSTARAEAITAPVKDAGILRMATGTWDRTNQSSLALGTNVLFRHTIASGYYNPQDPNQEQVGEGRMPSNASEGTAAAYTVTCWQTAYCTSNVVGPNVTIAARWFEQYNTCNNPDLDGGPGALAPAVQVGQNLATGLPGTAAAGTQSCWIVTIDMTGTAGVFVMPGDGNGVLNGVQDNDDFGWGEHMNVTGGTGVPASTGLILTGSPKAQGSPPATNGFGANTNPAWGFVQDGTTDGTGLDELDQFFIGDTTNASTNGCYWFGGYVNNNIWGGHWHELRGDDGGTTGCGDGGSPGNFCGPGGQFAGVAGTAQISGPATISLGTPTFNLSVINMGPTGGVDQPGQFIASQAPNAAPFALGNYVLCLDPTASFQRLLPVQVTAGGALNAVITIATGAQTATGTAPINLVAGTTHYFQRWAREPGVGAGSNLSDGIGICIVP